MRRYLIPGLCAALLFTGYAATESSSQTRAVEARTADSGVPPMQAGYVDETNRLVPPGGPRWIATPKRVRVYFGGQVIADSTNVHLLRESAVPAYYFPESDVKTGLFVPSRLVRNSPIRGDASFWSIKVGDRTPALFPATAGF